MPQQDGLPGASAASEVGGHLSSESGIQLVGCFTFHTKLHSPTWSLSNVIFWLSRASSGFLSHSHENLGREKGGYLLGPSKNDNGM